MGTIDIRELNKLKNLYYNKKQTMYQISQEFGIGIDAVVYFMRKHKLGRRNFSEANKVSFENKKPSFKKRRINTQELKELSAIGATLYWGEGHKSEKATIVDFANSDPEMIALFLKFLRKIYKINESRLRVYIYCYSDQNIEKLIKFWSKLTKVPRAQFTKPYIKKDPMSNSRKMQYGLVHLRYGDKKLLLSIKNLIQSYKLKYK